MSIERRAEYRVELDEGTDLAVTVPNPEDSPFSGRLLDVSGSGAGVQFRVPDCPILTLGHAVKLTFTSKRLKAPVTVPARVQNRTEEEGSCRYGFRFLEGEPLHAQLPPELRKLFNRRKALRIVPDPESPVPVVIEGGGGGLRVEARLADLSPIGAGVILDSEAESRLANAVRVGLSLSLPDYRVPVHLIGNIRYRRVVGAWWRISTSTIPSLEIRYGIAFDEELSENFARQQDIIIKYVMERQ